MKFIIQNKISAQKSIELQIGIEKLKGVASVNIQPEEYLIVVEGEIARTTVSFYLQDHDVFEVEEPGLCDCV